MSSAMNAQAKDWHSSRYIGKRASYLLEHPDEEIPSDVFFMVGDWQDEPQKVFRCHKFLLAMVSSMFQAMFCGSFPQTDELTKIKDVTPAAFQIMLRYAYGENIGSDDIGNLDDALDTLYCAKKYMIDKLAGICRDRIQCLLGAFEVDPCVVFQRAPQMDEEDLTALALARIALDTSQVMQGDGLLRLSFAYLKKILDYPHLSAEEPDIYHGVRRWVEHNVESVNAYTLLEAFGSLLDSIRFPLFSPSELTDGPVMDGILSADEARSVVQFPLAEVNPVLPYLITPRSPLPAPMTCIFEQLRHNTMIQEWNERMRQLGRATDLEQDTTQLVLEARPDLAPECCAFLRDLLETKADIGFAFYGDDHPASCCSTYPRNTVAVAAAVTEETNYLSHSVKGGCWFEWDVKCSTACNVRIGVGRKPSIYHSAVFGFLLGCEDGQDGLESFQFWDDKRIEEVAGFGMSLSTIT